MSRLFKCWWWCNSFWLDWHPTHSLLNPRGPLQFYFLFDCAPSIRVKQEKNVEILNEKEGDLYKCQNIIKSTNISYIWNRDYFIQWVLFHLICESIHIFSFQNFWNFVLNSRTFAKQFFQCWFFENGALTYGNYFSYFILYF